MLNVPPDYEPLLQAANVTRCSIESDEVPSSARSSSASSRHGLRKRVRRRQHAQRFAPAQIPVIDIFATADSGRNAITLADKTAEAFQKYIVQQQDRAR